VPVRDLANRYISRFLRAQRKNLRRTFAERGQLDLLAQLEELKRNPRLDFMEKNKRFQRIINEYLARTAPAPVPEAAHPAVVGNGAVELPADAIVTVPESVSARPADPEPRGPGAESDSGVSGLAPTDADG
jgi:hypothetical protein